MPLDRSRASSPLHAVRCYSVHWSQAHFVKFALKAHVPHTKSVVISRLCALHTEVKPRFVVTDRCVRQAVSTHQTLKVIREVSLLDAALQITRVKLTRNNHTVAKLKSVLLWLTLQNSTLFKHYSILYRFFTVTCALAF